MSSGFFGFFAHTGMLEALIARGLRPGHVGGSSAGALVAGAFAAGVSPAESAGMLTALDRAAFWDPAPGLGLLAGRKFDALLRRILPTTRFEDCAVPVRISVFDILARRSCVAAARRAGQPRDRRSAALGAVAARGRPRSPRPRAGRHLAGARSNDTVLLDPTEADRVRALGAIVVTNL